MYLIVCIIILIIVSIKYLRVHTIIHMIKNMAVYKRMTITLHPKEMEKLDRIRKKNKETKSGMIARLIQEYNE